MHLAQLTDHCFYSMTQVKLHHPLRFSRRMLVYVQSVSLVLHHWQVIVQILSIHQTQLRQYYLSHIFLIFFASLGRFPGKLQISSINQIINLLILYAVFVVHDVLYHRVLVRIQLRKLALALNVNTDRRSCLDGRRRTLFGQFDSLTFAFRKDILGLLHVEDIFGKATVAASNEGLVFKGRIFWKLEANGWGILLYHAFENEQMMVLLASTQQVPVYRNLVVGAIDDIRSQLDLVIWTILQSLYHLYLQNLKIVILRWCDWVIAYPLGVCHCIDCKLKMRYSFLKRHREEGRFKFRAHLEPPLPAADAEGEESKWLELLLDHWVHECQKLA